jgi:glycosyltransferase involved in cell wall biosynthesis
MEEKYWKNGGFAKISSDVSDYLFKTYVTSNHLKEILIHDYLRKDKEVEVAYINVDGKGFFNPNTIQAGTVRGRAKVSNNKLIVLFPCRLHHQKRPYLMIEIVNVLKGKGLDFQVWVVGDGPEENQMKKKTNELGLENYVIFWGATRDVRPYYRDADITLICSIKEGLALTAYESMAMGTPVITSDVGGQKELVTEDCGYVVPLLVDEKDGFGAESFLKEEVELYVNILAQAIQSPEQLKGKADNSRKRITDKFLLEDMIGFFEIEFTKIYNTEKCYKKNANQLTYSYLESYLSSLKFEKAAEEIWNARCYFEDLYNKSVELTRTNKQVTFKGLVRKIVKKYKFMLDVRK